MPGRGTQEKEHIPQLSLICWGIQTPQAPLCSLPTHHPHPEKGSAGQHHHWGGWGQEGQPAGSSTRCFTPRSRGQRNPGMLENRGQRSNRGDKRGGQGRTGWAEMQGQTEKCKRRGEKMRPEEGGRGRKGDRQDWGRRHRSSKAVRAAPQPAASAFPPLPPPASTLG